MNKGLIENWNAIVSASDEVIVVGDFSLSKEAVEAYSGLLNGKKTLVKGNHDRTQALYLANGWHAVHPRMCVTIKGLGQIQVQHIPYKTDGYLLCGHVHDKWKRRKNTLNMSVEQWDYKPVTEEQIVQALKEQDTTNIEHEPSA